MSSWYPNPSISGSMEFYTAFCSNFVIHCSRTLKQNTQQMLYWVKAESVCCSLTDCQAKSSVPGSYLTAERSSSLQLLSEYTLTYIYTLYRFSFFLSLNLTVLSIITSEQVTNNFFCRSSLSNLQFCQHCKSYWQSAHECLRLVVPFGTGCLLVHKVWRQ